MKGTPREAIEFFWILLAIAGVSLGLFAWFAPATRVEMAPARLEREWTIRIKGETGRDVLDLPCMRCRECKP